MSDVKTRLNSHPATTLRKLLRDVRNKLNIKGGYSKTLSKKSDLVEYMIGLEKNRPDVSWDKVPLNPRQRQGKAPASASATAPKELSEGAKEAKRIKKKVADKKKSGFKENTKEQKEQLEKLKKFVNDNKIRFIKKGDSSKALNLIKKMMLYSNKELSNSKIQSRFNDFRATENELSITYNTYDKDLSPTQKNPNKQDYLRTMSFSLEKPSASASAKNPLTNQEKNIVMSLDDYMDKGFKIKGSAFTSGKDLKETITELKYSRDKLKRNGKLVEALDRFEKGKPKAKAKAPKKPSIIVDVAKARKSGIKIDEAKAKKAGVKLVKGKASSWALYVKKMGGVKKASADKSGYEAFKKSL